MRRSGGGWGVVVAVLVALPMVLVAGVVGSVVVATNAVVSLVDDVINCPDADWRLTKDMAADAAATDLASKFPSKKGTQRHCDPDDRTAGIELELRTELPRERALARAEVVLERNGWRAKGSCHTKRFGSRTVWAGASYQDEFRTDRASDLSLSMTTSRDYVC